MPKKPERPRPSHTINHSNNGHTASSAGQSEDRALASPQKHREKRKHCDTAEADKHKHKHKKRKHSRDARFEGHRISHLVKKKTYNRAESEDNQAGDQKKSDDYVLAKLFKKSGGLQTRNQK